MAVATAREVAGARAFLRYLRAPTTTEMMYVVIAWLRRESGGLGNVRGNNPFNLRPGRDDAKFRSGIRQTGGIGAFSIYPTMSAGFRAAANRLLAAGDDYRGYGLIVRAFRTGNPNEALTAIAMSKWSATHYGWSIENPGRNKLIPIYNSFTGFKIPVPAKPKAKRKAPPKLPVNLHIKQVLPEPDYLKPLAPRSFYRDRHPLAKEPEY